MTVTPAHALQAPHQPIALDCIEQQRVVFAARTAIGGSYLLMQMAEEADWGSSRYTVPASNTYNPLASSIAAAGHRSSLCIVPIPMAAALRKTSDASANAIYKWATTTQRFEAASALLTQRR